MAQKTLFPIPFQGCDDPLKEASPSQGPGQAEAWARWAAKRDGIDLPYHINFCHIQEIESGVSYVAVFSHRKWVGGGLYGCPSKYEDEEFLRFPVPPHAAHFPRCDLWHLARQGGASPEECADVAQGHRWNVTPDLTLASKPEPAKGKVAQFEALVGTPARFRAALDEG